MNAIDVDNNEIVTDGWLRIRTMFAYPMAELYA
jgi:hypothetical protein